MLLPLMLTCTLKALSFTCDTNSKAQMNVGTYNGMSISLLLLYINIPLSIIFLPMFHTHLSPGVSSWTVYQLLADLVYQELQSYSTIGLISSDNMLRLIMFFSLFLW